MNKLDRIPTRFNEETGFEKILAQYRAKEILKFCRGNILLDLGCGIGSITRKLAKHFKKVIAVDGSENKIKKAKKITRDKNIHYIYKMFEDFKPQDCFDTIILADTLEHIENPAKFLKRIKDWLRPRGVIIAVVPNALGFHKRIGKLMGLINDYYSLTSEDVKKGHQRIYDKNLLRKDFEKSGYAVKYVKGFFLKPLSNKQMESIRNNKLNDALYEIGKELPDYCSSLIIIAKKKI